MKPCTLWRTLQNKPSKTGTRATMSVPPAASGRCCFYSLQHGAAFPQSEPSERVHSWEQEQTHDQVSFSHFLNPASGCYLRIRPAGSRLRASAAARGGSRGAVQSGTLSGCGGSHLAARCFEHFVGQRLLVIKGQGRFSCTAKGENCSESQ